MAQWGIKVSQPNKDVKTCADKDLAFSSQWNSLKIYSRGEGSLDVHSSLTDYTETELVINHNLGYCPLSFFIVKFGSNWIYSPGFESTSWGSSNFIWWHFTTDSQLKFIIWNWSYQAITIPYKYLILIEESA